MEAGQDGERMRGQVRGHGKGEEDIPSPSVSQRRAGGHRARGRLVVWPTPTPTLPLVPILAVGTRAGHAAPLLPRLGLPSQRLLHLQLDLRGAQPTDGQVVPGDILHRQLLLPCSARGGTVEGAEAGRLSALLPTIEVVMAAAICVTLLWARYRFRGFKCIHLLHLLNSINQTL